MKHPKTLFDKVWEMHVIDVPEREADLLYIDLHLMHEVTSPHAFNILRKNNSSVRRPEQTVATMDHQVPTKNLNSKVQDNVAKDQMKTLEENCLEHNITMFPWGSIDQGIVHVIGPEKGLTQPGSVIVCGDSHTSTHGAFGALAFGIGISEVAHVLSTQTLPQNKPKSMAVNLEGPLGDGVTAKDVILTILKTIGTTGGVGHVIEFRGEAIQSLSMEGRMTVCNMSIEAGARAGMIAPDEKTFQYLKDTPFAPKNEDWKKAKEAWKDLKTDQGANFDKEIFINAREIEPHITWGTAPDQSINLNERIPEPNNSSEEKALKYMELEPGSKMNEIEVTNVFIGSCTNARLEDLKKASKILKGKKIHSNVSGMVVPGSMKVKMEAEELGIDKIFMDAGFEWRASGCSMCVGMNEDVLSEGDRCASTSNRNFEGRQGKGAKTHLVSPEIAAATAIKGKFCSPKEIVGME